MANAKEQKMKPHKTMTVNQLHKMLDKLIRAGMGRLPVCINKETFQHNLESDGVVYLPVDGVRHESILIMNDDGGTVHDNGREKWRATAVLFGDSGAGFSGVLSSESVEDFIRQLHWSDSATDHEKTLVAGNIRNFAADVRRMTCGK